MTEIIQYLVLGPEKGHPEDGQLEGFDLVAPLDLRDRSDPVE